MKRAGLALGIITIIIGCVVFYHEYEDYIIKREGNTVEVEIYKVSNCNIRSKQYYLGFLFENKKRTLSISRSICKTCVVGKKMKLIYNSERDGFVLPATTPEYGIFFAVFILILGIIISIKGIVDLKKIYFTR
jgi:hypothetical protein